MRGLAPALVMAVLAVACREPTSPDATPPTVTIARVDNLSDDTTFSRLVVEGEATDDREVRTVQYWIGSFGPSALGWQNAQITAGPRAPFRIVLPSLGRSEYTLTVRATDASGHMAETSRVVVGGAQRSHLDLEAEPAPTDTIRGRGLYFVVLYMPRSSPGDTVRLTRLTIRTDSLSEIVIGPTFMSGSTRPNRIPCWYGSLTNGRHTLGFRATDNEGTTTDTSFTVVVRLDSATYDVEPLSLAAPDSRALDLVDGGAIAGSVVLPSGRTRAAVWNGSNPTLVGPEGGSGVAVTATGELLVQDSTRGLVYRAADGALLRTVECPRGSRAMGLTEDGAVLCGPSRPELVRRDGSRSLLAPNASFDSAHMMTHAGIAVGSMSQSGSYNTLAMRWRPAGQTLPKGPLAYPSADPIAGRYSARRAVLADDAGFVVVLEIDRYPYLVRPDLSTTDLFLPLGSARPTGLANGEIVAFDGSDSTAWRWGTRGVQRVQLTDPDWRLDGMGRMDGRGRILTHGVHRRTEVRGALLLVPAGAR